MNNEVFFRVIVLALFIGVRSIRSRARDQTGWSVNWPAMKRHVLDTSILILLTICWVMAVVVFVAWPHLVSNWKMPLPVWLRWIAVLLAVAALGLLAWSDRCLGTNLSVTLKIQENHTLVTHGPYRRVRHPIYAATLLYSCSMAAITANYVLAAAFVLPKLLLMVTRIGAEERMMIDQFGDVYRQYMHRTGRLLPRWRVGAEPEQTRSP